MNTCFSLGCVIRSVQKFALTALLIVLVAEQSAFGQTTNFRSAGIAAPGALKLLRQQPSAASRSTTNFAAAVASKDVLKAQMHASLAESGAHYRMWTVG